jgi:hypothetical protein
VLFCRSIECGVVIEAQIAPKPVDGGAHVFYSVIWRLGFGERYSSRPITAV